MTTKILHCHPATPNDSIQSLSVKIEPIDKAGLTLRYRLAGNLEKILIPADKPSVAVDGLWLHTCFEAFTAAGTSSYREFNFSPSGEWAAYAFGNYRARTPFWTIGTPPVIEALRSPDLLLLTARIAANDLPAGAPLRLGLNAVIESSDGHLSYWALHHSGERPDFHDRTGFVCPLDPIPSDNSLN